MSLLSTDQIVNLAESAGFQGSDLATAVAVALAESSGNTQAVNQNEPHGASYGLWQIYLYAHPSFDPNQLVNDPQYNANAAYQVYREAGSSFRPWTTFNSGKYRGFLPGVEVTIAAMSPAPILPAPVQIVMPPEPSSSDITNGTTPETDGSTVATATLNPMAILILGGLAYVFLRR